MVKSIRKWVKDEKRIVRLLYRKGLIKETDLYWAEYRHSGRTIKSPNGKYRHTVYFPEVHYCTTDYWGECDEHSIVDSILDNMHWSDLKPWDEKESTYPESNFKYKGRAWFIRYLSKLKTVRNDSEINSILKRNHC